MYDLEYDRDVAVIGGGVAGLAAALLLGRGNIDTVVISDPKTWHPSSPTHNFLTNDGRAKKQIIEDGRKDVEAYVSVQFTDARVTSLDHDGIGYNIALDNGETLFVERLILANGGEIRPDLMGIDGLAERFGQRVFTCPYCHAHEFSGQRIGLIRTKPTDVDFATLLAHWGDQVTVFHHQAGSPEAGSFDRHNNVDSVVKELRGEIDGPIQIVTEDGAEHEVDALFVSDMPGDPDGGLAAGLNLERVAHPMTGNPIWKTDAVGRTQLGTSFVIGDSRTGFSTLAGAANEGQIAGFMIINDIIEARKGAMQLAP